MYIYSASRLGNVLLVTPNRRGGFSTMQETGNVGFTTLQIDAQILAGLNGKK